MNGFLTHANVNILPLGSYDLLIGMNWIEKHQVVLNCFVKTFTCTDDNRDNIKVKGIPRNVTIKVIYVLQMKGSVRKGCKVFVFYIMNSKENDNKLELKDTPVLKEFEDIFSKEVLRLPLKIDIHFTIILIPDVVPKSNALY